MGKKEREERMDFERATVSVNERQEDNIATQEPFSAGQDKELVEIGRDILYRYRNESSYSKLKQQLALSGGKDAVCDSNGCNEITETHSKLTKDIIRQSAERLYIK